MYHVIVVLAVVLLVWAFATKNDGCFALATVLTVLSILVSAFIYK
jgi:hypothetical protein